MVQKNNRLKLGVEPRLDNSLLLGKYMLSLFGVQSLEELASNMKSPNLEGWDEENVSYYCRVLCNQLERWAGMVRVEDVVRYDRHIYEYTLQINEYRQDKVIWKYFQWLELLFTEVYLDKYFSDREGLVKDINRFRKNDFLQNNDYYTEPFFREITAEQLNKISVWCATGSGKTLMMHVNMLQLRYYADLHGMVYNNTLLITPKESLSAQHVGEMELSGIQVQVFSKKGGGLYKDQYVQVTEITKLADEDGELKVNVDFFEKNNLVFIDEGHRGASGDSWKKLRDKLSEAGFCFEYSATFGQSIAAEGNKKKRNELLWEYGLATLFDYSYKYFYEDGYGKDFVTRNVKVMTDAAQEYLYMLGGLLGFYEQLRLYNDKKEELMSFNIEKPAAIFVGNTVKSAKSELSDIVRLVQFFQQFTTETDKTIEGIKALLRGEDGLVDAEGYSIYKDAFAYLRELNMDASKVYGDMMTSIFNSSLYGVQLHLDRIAGVDGEIGMRMGNSSYFGVINVGNPADVVKACASFVHTDVRDYNRSSLFENINKKKSTINILIGAKKFTEGWSSWRVSTMCLLNVGQGDGSEIIQLFGRGVRLKGYGFSLKRTCKLDKGQCPDEVPGHIGILETLNIFGLKADYMDEFSRIIKDEGVEVNVHDKVKVELPLMPNVVDLEKKRLKYLCLKKGKKYIKDVPLLRLDMDATIAASPVVVDRYSQIKTFSSSKSEKISQTITKDEAKLGEEQLALIDWTKLYVDLCEYKRQRGMYNLTMQLQTLKEVAANTSWYILYVPKSSLIWDDYLRVSSMWQEILTTLMQGYIDKYYKNHKSIWVNHNLETVSLTSEMAGLDEKVLVQIDKGMYDDFKQTLELIKSQLENRSFASTIRIGYGFLALYFSRHLYSPLMYYNGKLKDENGNQLIEISPVALVDSEFEFVNKLTEYVNSMPKVLEDHEVYLLRNQSKTGVGFFAEAGFYPDFILWIVKGRHQYVSFIDPHGLGRAKGFADPKVQLFQMLQHETEPEIGDKNLSLNSFILSPTRFGEVMRWGLVVKPEATIEDVKNMFVDHHVYFMKEDGRYIDKMIHAILTSGIV